MLSSAFQLLLLRLHPFPYVCKHLHFHVHFLAYPLLIFYRCIFLLICWIYLFIHSTNTYLMYQMWSLHWGYDNEQWLLLIKLLLKIKDIYELCTVASPHWVVKLRFIEATVLPNIIYWQSQNFNPDLVNSIILGTLCEENHKNLWGMVAWETWFLQQMLQSKINSEIHEE